MASNRLYVVKKIGNGSYVLLSTGQIMPTSQARAAKLEFRPVPTAASKDTERMIAKARPVSHPSKVSGVSKYTPTTGDNPLESAITPLTGNFWDNATPSTRPKKVTPKSTIATQKFLKSKGYNIEVDGNWGPQTQSAALNWRSTRNPDIWNRSVNATPSTRPTFSAPKAAPTRSAPATHANAGAPMKTPTAPTAPAGKPAPTLMEQLMGMLVGVPKADMIPLSLAKGPGGIPLSDVPDISGALLDPRTAQADMEAQYGPLIQAAKNQLGVVPYDTAQHLADIKNWFDQIKGSVQQASSDVGQIASTGAGMMGADAGGIAASLGGNANAGGQSIATEGANQVNVINQIGDIEKEYLAGMGPVLSTQAAAAANNETARQQGFARDFTNQILQIQAQKAQGMSDRLMQIAQYNQQLQQERFQNLMSVKQYNAGLSQQQLQNMLGIRTANQSATQQNFSNRLALAGFGLTANNADLNVADTKSTIAARGVQTGLAVDANTRANVQMAAGISQAKRNAQLAAQNAALRMNQDAQTAQLSGLMAAGQAVGTLTGDANGKPQPWSGVIPKNMLQTAVRAARGAVAGLPPAVQKRVMRSILSTFKNEKGQPLLTMAQIRAWGY